MSRNRLYSILTLACFAGYVWLFLNFSKQTTSPSNDVGICLIKHVTNIPCPSCGSTRSIVSILHGKYLQGLYFNPLGFILLLILTLTPVWLSYDYLHHKNTLFRFYIRMELFLKRKNIAIPAVILILVNWVWNIYKDI